MSLSHFSPGRFFPLFLVLALAIGLSALSACTRKEEAPATKAGAAGEGEKIVVTIGHIAPMTGPQAHLGKDNDNGVRMAIDEANAAGVRIGDKVATFRLITEDDQADPKTGTIVAQKLVDQRVNGIIGHLNSGTTIPASRIYADAGIPQISPSATNPKYTQQGYKTTFRVMANDVQQGGVLGRFAVEHLKVKKIAVIDDRTAYGQGLADELEKAAKAAGAQVVAREFTTDKSTDFMAILTSIKSKKPDLLFYGGMDAQAGPMMKQVRTIGLTSIFLAGDGGCTPEFIKLAGSEPAEGAYCSLPGLPVDQMQGGKEFAAKFNSKYGQIQLYAPFCYDAVNVMIAAMKKAGSAEPARYLPVLGGIAHDGVTATIQFDEKGDLKGGAISLYQVKSGAWSFVETMGQDAPPAAAAGEAGKHGG